MSIASAQIYAVVLEELNRTDKAEIRQLINKEIDKKLKSQHVKDMVEDEVGKALKRNSTKQEIGDISKKVLKALYRDMSLKHPYMIDRIKV